MTAFFQFFDKISPRWAGLFLFLTSAVALAGALVGQYGFDLHPCELCIYQRIPFVLICMIGVVIILKPSWVKPLTILSSALFFINTCIAFYHSGVERKWWAGLSGCSTPDMSGSIEDVLKRIQETSVVRCDEIPWDFLGLSMANYNVVYCLGLGVICLMLVCKKS
jgi:disulfide bond formation protein DsbB